MKFRLLLLALAATALTMTMSACLKDVCQSTRTFIRMDPVYKTPEQCRADIGAQAARPMKNPGKIYVYGTYLFINEIQEGVHVFDNSNPADPKPLMFWSIPGNVDIAIKGQYLYADQYIDLLTIDIRDMQNPRLSCRSKNAFALHGYDPYRGYIVEYTRTEVTEEIDCDNQQAINQGWFRRGDVVFAAADAFNGAPQTGGPVRGNVGTNPVLAAAGIAGSYARLALYDDYLYGIDHTTLRPFSLRSPSCPAKLDSVPVGWNIETIFPWKNRLFIGSQSGVFIFNNSNPARPVSETFFSHATGCDPVVCDENYAYVTVHDASNCRGTVNSLFVVGIAHLPATAQLAVYDMKKPKGLSVSARYLYLCDDGLKIFDKSKPTELRQLAHLKGLNTYDVIALDEKYLLVIGEDGFYQYDVSDPANPKQLSRIGVN